MKEQRENINNAFIRYSKLMINANSSRIGDIDEIKTQTTNYQTPQQSKINSRTFDQGFPENEEINLKKQKMEKIERCLGQQMYQKTE